MKTDIDPIFEQKDNRDFGKQFVTNFIKDLVTLITVILIISLLLLVFGASHFLILLVITSPGIAFIYLYLRQQFEDFKHNDQR